MDEEENVPQLCEYCPCGNPPLPPCGTIPCLDNNTVAHDPSLHCEGDIAGASRSSFVWTHAPDGEVNVVDLLQIINNWGACPGGSQPKYFCHADIANCDGEVNVSDLLMVINNWGSCTGVGSSFPESLSECYSTYCNGLSGAEYSACIERCTNAYCSQTPTPPDCE